MSFESWGSVWEVQVHPSSAKWEEIEFKCPGHQPEMFFHPCSPGEPPSEQEAADYSEETQGICNSFYSQLKINKLNCISSKYFHICLALVYCFSFVFFPVSVAPGH